MNNFMGENVFLDNNCAKELFGRVKDLPILDYHCHLNVREIFENRRFSDIGTLWLEGDHYKWRLMRAAGIDEEYITGQASFDEKFLAFAKILPLAANNPVYHWSHMELKFYFQIEEPLNKDNAKEYLKILNEKMSRESITTRSLMKQSKVEMVCTTDDPADSLEYHFGIIEKPFGVRVRPTFRPDKAVTGINKSDFIDYVKRLMGDETSFEGWLDALSNSLERFVDAGCVVSDLSLSTIPYTIGTYEEAKSTFEKAINKVPINAIEENNYISFMVCFLARKYTELDIAMQLHLSSMRNNSTRLFDLKGLDCGNDSVGAKLDIHAFAKLLNKIEIEKALPKTIVYTLNQSDYYEIATLLGCFQGGVRGRAQLGAAWWFCDHKDGIIEQMKVLSATGLLGRFNGMLTDSRSFTAYVRHDYFRRILCSYLGELVSRGEYDLKSAEEIVKAICYENAKSYFEGRNASIL